MSKSITSLLNLSAALLVVLLLAGCSQPAPTATPTATPNATATPTAAVTPTPMPSPAAIPTQVPATGSASLLPGGVDIDLDTVWQEVFDTLTVPEQDCIRGALGDELEQTLAQPVLSEESGTPEGEAIFPCLEAETARAVFVAATLAAFTFGQGIGELSEGDVSCIREYLSDVDVAAIMAAPEGSPEGEEFGAQILMCFPTLLSVAVGLNPGKLSEEEASCIRRLDVATIIDASEDSLGGEELAGIVACVSGLPADAGPSLSLDEYAARCSRFAQLANLPEDATYGELVAEVTGIYDAMKAVIPPAVALDLHSKLLLATRALKETLGSQPEDDVVDPWIFFTVLLPLGLAQEAQESLPADVRARLTEAGCIEGSEAGSVSVEDDHGEDFESATPVVVGADVEGSLSAGGDRDAFIFHAEANQSYEVHLRNYAFGSIGSATGPLVAVYGPDGRELARSDDQSFRTVTWQSGAAGWYYVVIGDGARNGSYTLTVASAMPAPAPEVLRVVTPTPGPVSDDDHGNDTDSATAIEIGEPAEGVIETGDDLDVFRFTAEAGRTYHIEGMIGTLSDWFWYVTLIDPHGVELQVGRDFRVLNKWEGGQLIEWDIPESGDYYVAVQGGFGAGEPATYTLTVALSGAPTPVPETGPEPPSAPTPELPAPETGSGLPPVPAP